MKLLKSLFILTALLISQNFTAQDFDLKWSEKMKYDNKKGGFFKEFLGATENNIFVVNNNLALSQKKANKQLNVIVYDKETMAKKGIIKLI
ncbi:MAG: hypothetical protein ACK5B9_16710, partial [Flavobacteriia bacterium]